MKIVKLKVVSIISIIFLLVVSYAWVHIQKAAQSTVPKATPAVSVSKITADDVQPTLEAIGILQANQGTILKAQTDGQVESIHFSPGDQVNIGDVLVILNNAQQKGALDAAIAQEALNKTMYQRDLELEKLGAISLAEVDQAKAAVEAGDAAVHEAQGAYNLTVIKAPFSGRVGISKVHLGDYLQAGDAVVSVQNTDPMFIDFYLPQKYFSSIKVGAMVRVNANTAKTLIQGHIVSYETVIDQTTGMLQIRALVPNSEQMLLPGGYATLQVNSGDVSKVIRIPQTALMYDIDGAYVYLVKDNIAHIKRVMLGEQINQKIQILQGLQTGDTIVTVGGNKLREGAAVQIVASDKAQV